MKNADHKEFCVKVAGLCRLNRARLSYKWLQQCFSSRFLLLLMLITVAVVAAAVVVTIVGVFFLSFAARTLCSKVVSCLHNAL